MTPDGHLALEVLLGYDHVPLGERIAKIVSIFGAIVWIQDATLGAGREI